MIIQISLLAHIAFSLTNNRNPTFNDDQLQFLKLNDSTGNSSDTNSTVETPPTKRKFPFTPVLVSAAFVIFVGILALVYLIKKLKARKNYKDLESHEREVQLIPNDDQQEHLKPLENSIEPVGIDSQKEKKEEFIDPENKEEPKEEQPAEEQKEEPKEEQKEEEKKEEPNDEQKEDQKEDQKEEQKEDKVDEA